MLFTLTGASAVGKSVLMKRLLSERPRLKRLRSSTTRASRPGDPEGEYLYVSEDEFRTMAILGEFAWTMVFSSASYGTLSSDLRQALVSDEIYLSAVRPECIPLLHDFARLEGMGRFVRSLYIKAPSKMILLRRMMVDREEPAELAHAKLKECSDWDRRAFDTRLNGKEAYLFVTDRDDLADKQRQVLTYLDRPW